MGLAARSFHAMQRGAADRLWEWLAPQLAARAVQRVGNLSRRAPG